MGRASVRELHLDTSGLMKHVAQGEAVLIKRRGVPVAELRPISLAFSGKVLPDRKKLLAKFPKVGGDSGRFLEEDRS